MYGSTGFLKINPHNTFQIAKKSQDPRRTLEPPPSKGAPHPDLFHPRVFLPVFEPSGTGSLSLFSSVWFLLLSGVFVSSVLPAGGSGLIFWRGSPMSHRPRSPALTFPPIADGHLDFPFGTVASNAVVITVMCVLCAHTWASPWEWDGWAPRSAHAHLRRHCQAVHSRHADVCLPLPVPPFQVNFLHEV